MSEPIPTSLPMPAPAGESAVAPVEEGQTPLPRGMTTTRESLRDWARVGKAVDHAGTLEVSLGRQNELNELLMQGVRQMAEIGAVCADPETKLKLIEAQAKLGGVITAGEKRVSELSEKISKQKRPGATNKSMRPRDVVVIQNNFQPQAQASGENKEKAAVEV